ncbi:uncharacterized protein A4U43_C03F21350 [Asparagus officinalis]|uniref:Uncharacterized protein n=1 Tax=Asparagus officinalis TaxID=4686 RepID=A0A5P1FCU4_ASPOF|nr:uncharacterized protein A4U43_C03F21350 [Asparagus officinalis]
MGSKDRAPGLGTKAVEPPNWSTRFCEVNDTGLRDWVLQVFADRNTGLLPCHKGRSLIESYVLCLSPGDCFQGRRCYTCLDELDTILHSEPPPEPKYQLRRSSSASF